MAQASSVLRAPARDVKGRERSLSPPVGTAGAQVELEECIRLR